MASGQIGPLTREHLPTVLDIWSARRGGAGEGASGLRPLADRRALVEARLRAALAERGTRGQALVATRAGEAVAYLIGREVRLPPGSTYLTYVPERFLNIGADDWGAATGEATALADLYAEMATWAVRRRADTQLIAIEPGAPHGDLWHDLGFARHDAYAFLPREGVRAGGAGVTVRRAGMDDLDVATEMVLAEARYHHAAPIFAFAPPGIAAAKRRDLAENLDDGAAFVLLASVGDRIAGVITAYLLAEPPSWAATAVPTPCLYIDSAFVRPEVRGQGVLRALVAALADAAPDGTAGLFVTYLPANRGAARAWVGLGFRPFAVIHQRRIDGRAADQWRE